MKRKSLDQLCQPGIVRNISFDTLQNGVYNGQMPSLVQGRCREKPEHIPTRWLAEIRGFLRTSKRAAPTEAFIRSCLSSGKDEENDNEESVEFASSAFLQADLVWAGMP